MINSSISSSGIRQAAQRCEGDTIGRLAINTSAACDGIASTVRDTVTVVSDTVRAVGLKAKTVCNSRDKRLAWQYDELDAAKALLEGFERQLSVHISEESDFEASMRTARLLLDHVTFLPSLSVALFPGVSAPFVSEVSRMSRVQKDADSANSSVSSPHLWRRGERAKVSVCCRDALGEGLRTVTVDDVSVVEPGVGWCVGPSTVEAGTIVVEVTRAMDAEHHENPTPTLRVFVGCSPIDVPLQVRAQRYGNYAHSVCVARDLSSPFVGWPQHRRHARQHTPGWKPRKQRPRHQPRRCDGQHKRGKAHGLRAQPL